VKRVLIIAWYFPPAGGSAVQRTLAMARHLPEHGWEPVIVTARPERASYPSEDRALLASVPPGLEVIRVSGPDPYALYRRWTGRGASVGFADSRSPGIRERVARWIRANLFLPDARVGWSRRAGRAAEEIVRGRPFDAVLTTGPPHSLHLAGLRASRTARIPLVVDLRDAWPDPTYQHHLPVSGPARRYDERLRSRVLDAASAVVAVSGPMADDLSALAAGTVSVIGNGFEEDDFRDLLPVPHEGFELLHAGNLPAERDVPALWSAIAGLRAGGGLASFRVTLLGATDAAVRGSVARYGLESIVTLEPSVPHGEAVRRLAGADALLLSVNRVAGAEGIVTGKVYEYVASGRPVLGVGPPGGEADRVLRTSGAGVLLGFDDVEGIREHLRTLYGAWASGQPIAGASPARARPFGRRARVADLAGVLDAVTAHPARR